MSRPTRRALLVGLAALPLAGISSFEALFAPRSDLWERWPRHDPAATARIEHGPWAAFLARTGEMVESSVR